MYGFNWMICPLFWASDPDIFRALSRVRILRLPLQWRHINCLAIGCSSHVKLSFEIGYVIKDVAFSDDIVSCRLVDYKMAHMFDIFIPAQSGLLWSTFFVITSRATSTDKVHRTPPYFIYTGASAAAGESISVYYCLSGYGIMEIGFAEVMMSLRC